MAFWTLPALRHFVHTYARCALPFRRTRTRWRLGSKRRFVATIEWLRWLPNPGFFPQMEQTLGTAGNGSGLALLSARSGGGRAQLGGRGGHLERGARRPRAAIDACPRPFRPVG